MDSTPEVYVGNFPTSFTAEDLLSLFQDFEGIRIRSFKKTKDNKCFAFLSCRNECQVIDIVTIMHDIDVCKRRLVVKAKDKELHKRIEESLQSSDGLKKLIQSYSRSNAKNDSSNIEKKNSIDEIVEKFPSAVRFKNPRLETPAQEKVRSPATDVPIWKILSQFSHQDAKACEVLNNDNKVKVKPNSNDGNSTQFDACNSRSFPDKKDVNKHQIPCHPKPNQNGSVTNAPNLGSSAQSIELASSPLALQPQMGQKKFENRGRGQNGNRANRNDVSINRSNSQFPNDNGTKHQSLQIGKKEIGNCGRGQNSYFANRNDVPFNCSNSQFPNDNGTKHQSLQMGKKEFGNRGRGQNSYRANGNDVPFDHSNLQFPNDNGNKYQSPEDNPATAQHHKSTMDVSPSQAKMGHSRTVYPEQDNASPYQVHDANHNPDVKTPRSMARQNRVNMSYNPPNNSNSQKEFKNDVLNSNLVPNQSMSTQGNFSITNLPTTDISYDTISKRPYNAELMTPDTRNAKSYRRDISDTNSTGTTASENSVHRRVLLPTPETTPKGLFQRGQILHQKQQLSNQGNKLRRKSSESAENGSRASSSLGSYDGEEVSKEKLFYLSVANFPFGTSRKDLRYLFEDFEPCNIVMICNVPLRNRRPTEAIIGFKSEDQVTNAILNIDNTDYMGRVIIVTDAVDCSILPSLMEVSPKNVKQKQHYA